MSKVEKVWAREILDSRGIPTVEAACKLDTGHIAVTAVPAGTSTSSLEAVELRDKDPKRYQGKGVLNAVKNVNEVLGPGIWGMDAENQKAIDDKLVELDGTENKAKYGGNAILAVSQAVVKTTAVSKGIPLYNWVNSLARQVGIDAKIHIGSPLFNMINGGLHGAGNLDFQEFLVIPASSKTYGEAIRMAVEIYQALGKDLDRKGAIHSVGHEGGYAPNLFTNADALEVLVESIGETDYQLGRDVFLGLDVAASVFYSGGQYSIRDKSSPLKDDALLEYYKQINNQYHLAVLEDAFHEDAWDSWKKLYAELADQVTIVGDDLLSTNPKRVQKAIQERACNSILVKPNQIGTISETLGVIKMAKDAGWKIVVSHRSGETNDWFIADFAVGVGSDFVKFGAPARGERVVKYNRLSSIELELQNNAGTS